MHCLGEAADADKAGIIFNDGVALTVVFEGIRVKETGDNQAKVTVMFGSFRQMTQMDNE